MVNGGLQHSRVRAAQAGAACSCPWPRAAAGVQAATGGELATKAYSSGSKRGLKPVQLSVQLSCVACSRTFPLRGCSRCEVIRPDVRSLNHGPEISV